MNQSKFTWGEVIGIFAALIFGFVCYMSMYLQTLGDVGKSLTTAVVFSLALWFLAFLLVRMKKASRNFKLWYIAQAIMLLLFAGSAYFALRPFSHIFTVSRHKTEILEKTGDNISQINNMFNEYKIYSENRINYYMNDLQTAIRGKYANPAQYAIWGFDASSGVPDEARKESLVNELRTGLFELGYVELHSSARAWLMDAKSKCTHWNPLPLANIIYSVEKQGNEWKKQLSAFSVKAKMQGENVKPFDYTISFDEVTSLFKTVSSPTIPAILSAVAIFLLMLFPWMIARKHPRNNIPFLKLLFGNNSDDEDGRL